MSDQQRETGRTSPSEVTDAQYFSATSKQYLL